MASGTDVPVKQQTFVMQIFSLWLILTAVPLVAFALDRLITQQGYNSSREYSNLAMYVSAPLGSGFFMAPEAAAIALAVSASAIIFGFLFIRGVKVAYWGSIILLFFGMGVSVGTFYTLAFIYAVPVNIGWLWFLFNDQRNREVYRIDAS